jgi:coenzyme PQQ synthesis protein D (PqqD)
MPRIRLCENVAHRSFGEETVLLNLDTGQYHGLRGSGGRMLEVLVAQSDLDESARQIAAEFDAPLEKVRHDIEVLCEGLAQRALVTIEDA